MKILVFGRTEFALDCLKELKYRNIDVVFIPSPTKNQAEEKFNQFIEDFCKNNNIVVYSFDYFKGNRQKFREENFDYIFSALHSRIFKKEDMDVVSKGVINFHASPTPPIRGFAGYTQAFLNKLDYWGATSFFIFDEGIDNGPIIERTTFPFDWEKETAFSLKKKTYPFLIHVLKSTIEKIISNSVSAQPQVEVFYSLNKSQFEENKLIKGTENDEEIERKIRGYWFPPYEGASLVINQKKYTLILPEILKNRENFE